MKLNKFVLNIVGVLFGIIILQSCNNDGPDYGKMRPSRMDIAGAKSIGFIYESVASRGEAISSGLYKIDANGNISAVAVYFTEDEYGNVTNHEDEIHLSAAKMNDAGKDYILFRNCSFVDKNGEYISGLPRHILVRKSDGKMWDLSYNGNMPYIESSSEISWRFYQANDGTLYYNYDNIYKLNLNTEPATIEQITANVNFGTYAVDSKGIVGGSVNVLTSLSSFTVTLAWPNSGFQRIELENYFQKDYSNVEEGLKFRCNASHCCVNFCGQFYSICNPYEIYLQKNGSIGGKLADYPFIELGTCNKILIGDAPGSAAIDESETISIKNDIKSAYGYEMNSVMVTDDYILTSGYARAWNYKDSKYWITALNPVTKEWIWLTETPGYISFDKSINYNNRYWVITTIDENLGAWWFNPTTHESGFVNFNVTIPTYMDGNYNFVNGNVIYSGINPADSHQVKIIIDIMTGEAITNDNAPEYMFSTLISLN